ncbi:MAG: hypothetical protein LUE12_01240 [Ruminococcus sp.]|nr:hypothetical protein [Ruminococcus sp.]
MFFIFPKKYEFYTTLTPKQCANKLRRELVDFQRKPSLVAANKFFKAHRQDDCYYGSWESGGSFEVFYHHAKKHDGSSAGFFGSIKKSDDGSVITGKLRRTVPFYIVCATWTLILLFLILCLLALKEYEGALCTVAVFVIGLLLICQDNSAQEVKGFLSSFPSEESFGEESEKN